MMRLYTFEAKSRFGVVQRIGIQTPGGRILDLNLAYALTLAESQHHPRAYELSNELVPPDMLGFLRNGQFGRNAANEALAHLGPRADAADLVEPSGCGGSHPHRRRVVHEKAVAGIGLRDTVRLIHMRARAAQLRLNTMRRWRENARYSLFPSPAARLQLPTCSCVDPLV